MNSRGRVCWRGVSPSDRLQPRTCNCHGRDPPPFDLVFPGSAGTVAPSTWSNESVFPVRTSALPTGAWATGGGGGGGGDTISASVTPGGNVAAKEWGNMHPRSVKLLIGASITLFIIILFLGCLLYCFTKKKKKKRHDIVQRPGPEGCEANRVQYDVPVAPDQHPNNKNEYPLLQIDEPSPKPNEIPTTRDVSSGTDSPFVVRNFPVLRTVKAAVVNMGSSPKKVRPVSRQDSTAPLVEHQASIFRDRRKDKARMYGTAAEDIDSNRLSADGDDADVQYPDHRDRLATLNEDDIHVPNGKLPTKIETLPSRMYPAQSVMETPSSKRSNKRPDSSTPLFDSDSISSSEA